MPAGFQSRKIKRTLGMNAIYTVNALRGEEGITVDLMIDAEVKENEKSGAD